MEIIVDFCYLSEVLLLHLAPRFTFATVLLWIREKNLVYDYIMDVDFLLGKLNCKSFSLVHTQELRNTYSNEGGLLCIFELFIYLFNLSLHSIDAIKEPLLHIFWVSSLFSHH